MNTDTTTAVPLCVDLDGTLIRTDSLHASLFLLARKRPWMLVLAPLWVFSGKARFKQSVAQSVTLNVAALPYDERVRDFIRAAHESGQPVWLVSGCHESIARRVAEHLGCFDGVLASNAAVNLTSTDKRDELCRRFGMNGYDYIGNSSADLPVWSCARRVLVANPSNSLLQQVRRDYAIAHLFP